MFFITCSKTEHHFNKITLAYNYAANPEGMYEPWDRKCDCGKRKLPVKEVNKFLKQFDLKHKLMITRA